MTSHGSKKDGLAIRLRGLPLNDLTPQKLDQLLDDNGIKWKVIVVSACYSGEFVDALKDDHTLIMTSSRKDRNSFGCSDEEDFTYFGRALFKHGIPETSSFTAAFTRADELVRQWEGKTKYKHSEPQIWYADPIVAQLQAWRNTLQASKRISQQ